MLWFGALEEGYDLSDLQNIIKEVLASKGIKCSYEEEYGDGILIETPYKYKNSFPLSDLIWAAFKYKFAENQATECMIREVTCLLNQDTDEQSVNYYDLDNDDDPVRRSSGICFIYFCRFAWPCSDFHHPLRFGKIYV